MITLRPFQKPSTTTWVLNGVYGSVNRGDLGLCQKGAFVERVKWRLCVHIAITARQCPHVFQFAMQMKCPMKSQTSCQHSHMSSENPKSSKITNTPDRLTCFTSSNCASTTDFVWIASIRVIVALGAANDKRVSDLLCMSNSVHASLTKEHEDNDDYEGSIR